MDEQFFNDFLLKIMMYNFKKNQNQPLTPKFKIMEKLLVETIQDFNTKFDNLIQLQAINSIKTFDIDQPEIPSVKIENDITDDYLFRADEKISDLLKDDYNNSNGLVLYNNNNNTSSTDKSEQSEKDEKEKNSEEIEEDKEGDEKVKEFMKKELEKLAKIREENFYQIKMEDDNEGYLSAESE